SILACIDFSRVHFRSKGSYFFRGLEKMKLSLILVALQGWSRKRLTNLAAVRLKGVNRLWIWKRFSKFLFQALIIHMFRNRVNIENGRASWWIHVQTYS